MSDAPEREPLPEDPVAPPAPEETVLWAPEPSKGQNPLSFAAKLLFSVGLLAFLLSRVDLTQFFGILGNIDWVWIFWAFVAGAGSIVATGLRWWLLLRTKQLHLGFFQSLRIYWIGYFFNNFLPSSIGGDVFRVLKSGQLTKRRRECAATVLVERLIGLLAILGMGLAALVISPERDKFIPVLIFLSVGTVGTLAAAVMLLWDRSNRAIRRFIPTIHWHHLGERLEGFMAHIQVFRHSLGALHLNFWISVLFQFLVVVCCWCLAQALHIELDLGAFLFVVPVVGAVSMLPVSINGLGLREGGFVFLLAGFGVAKEPALALSLLNMVLFIVLSALGGFLYIGEQTRNLAGSELSSRKPVN